LEAHDQLDRAVARGELFLAYLLPSGASHAPRCLESIRRGRPAIPGYEAWLGEDRRRWAVFQAGMLAVARTTS